jgi:hypothetical protein
MNAVLLFLMAVAAGFVGLSILSFATTALQEIEALIAMLAFAVLIGASGICSEVQLLRKQARTGSGS